MGALCEHVLVWRHSTAWVGLKTHWGREGGRITEPCHICCCQSKVAILVSIMQAEQAALERQIAASQQQSESEARLQEQSQVCLEP